jgi:hypothetical protein
MPIKILVLPLISFALLGCQSTGTYDETAELDGVWRGVVSGGNSHESLQAHVLDGLMLTIDLNGEQAHSGELVLDSGELSGLFAQRASAGERDEDYAIAGFAKAYDRIEADLLGSQDSKSMSLFYDESQSFAGASYFAAEGLYAYYGPDLQITLSIGQDGHIEGYDDVGCAYFGGLSIPDPSQNIYAVSLEVSGCALSGETGFGIGSLTRDIYGEEELTLPMWFYTQDRVEAWILQRV